MPLSVLDGERSPVEMWIERDAVLAMALTEYEAGLCPDCGQPRHESMDPANEGQYVAPLPIRCHSCTAVIARAADYDKADQSQALKFTSSLAARSHATPPGQAP